MREEILELMLEKCTEVFGAADLTSTTRFSDLGAGSVQMVQIATFFENEYDVEIPFMDFNRQNNIKEAVDYLISLLED